MTIEMVSDELIQRVVDKLVAEYAPQQVILLALTPTGRRTGTAT